MIGVEREDGRSLFILHWGMKDSLSILPDESLGPITGGRTFAATGITVPMEEKGWCKNGREILLPALSVTRVDFAR